MSNTVSYTYGELVAEIQNWCEDEGTEFTATLPRLIALGESRVMTDLNIEVLDRIIEADLTPGNPVQPIKGADWQGTRSLWIRDPRVQTDPGPPPVFGPQTGNIRYLEPRSLEWCREYWPDPDEQAEPLYYAELEEDSYYLVPTPDDNYRAFARIITNPGGLTEANQTTWLATNMGDLLLWSCLLHSDKYLKSDEALQQSWLERYMTTLEVRRVTMRSVIRSEYAPVRNAARTVEPRA